MRPTDRIKWIDYAKSFGIFSVVLLHVHCDENTVRIINAFIMPLFFIVSEYLFSYSKNTGYKDFLYKRFRQLVIPYLWIGILSYGLWLLFLRNYGSNPMDDVIWYIPLIGTFAGIPSKLICNIPIWALLAFFIVEMIYFPLGKCIGKPWWLVIISLAILVISDCFFSDFLCDMPLVIGPSIAGLFFYSIGHCCRKYKTIDFFAPSYWKVIISAAIFVFTALYNETVSFYVTEYKDLLFFILSSLSGSLLVICVSGFIARLYYPRLVIFISDSTLLICGFHLLIFSLVKGVAYFGFGIGPEQLTNGFFKGLCFASVCFSLNLPLCYVIQKYMRFLVYK